MSHKNNGVDEELDYILQALGHRVRRKVIELLAEKGPLTYTELMKETGVDDSGTFGFHLRRMSRLLKKNRMGEYELTALGWKAYKTLCELQGKEPKPYTKPPIELGVSTTRPLEEEARRKETGGEEVKVHVEVGEEEEEGEEETIVISDRMTFELTERIARAYLEKGKKLIITDTMKVIIHPMPREVFDKVVERITDVLSLHAPRDLEDLVHMKTHDVLSIKFYKEKPPRVSLDLGGMIAGLVSSIVSGISGLVTSVSGSVPKVIVSKTGGKLILVREEPLPVKKDMKLIVDVTGGILEVKRGDNPKVKIWKEKDRDVGVTLDIGDKSMSIEVESGKCELILPDNSVRELDLDLAGGYARLKLNGLALAKIDVDGGWFRLASKTSRPIQVKLGVNGGGGDLEVKLEDYEGEAYLYTDVNGGVLRAKYDLPRDVRIKSKSDISGGWVNIKLNGRTIAANYEDHGYEEAMRKLRIDNEIYGGVVSVNIEKH